MCGIIGYIGKRSAAPILFDGLKRLEYRGYDSAGIATVGSGFHSKKDIGKVDEINAKHKLTEIPGKMGIAHTRWATHGKITQKNAHPHFSNNKKIAVVHNGIIENYQELKKFLVENGFQFVSETDTEVIPNLIEFEMREGKNFEEAIFSTLGKLEGYYAIVAMHDGEKKILAARKGSPLVVGVADGEYFVASDMPAFLEHTKSVQFMYDGDVALLGEAGVNFYNINEKKFVERKLQAIDWNIEQAQKGNFDHFTIKEILEQVDTVKRATRQNREEIRKIVDEIKNSRGVFFVGAGSSYHACMTASYMFSKVAKMHVNVVLASEFPNYEDFLTPKTLVVAFSQSGETIDVLDAVRVAKKRRSKVISVVNVMGSSLTRESDSFVMLNAGPEISVMSTKSYTSQVALLGMIAYELVGKLNEEKDNLRYLWNIIYNLTSENVRSRIGKLAETLRRKEHIFLIGRGMQYTTAMEAALKIKEISYIHAEALAGGEIKHGTISLVEKGVPCIIFVKKENEKEILSNAMELKSRGAYIIGVSAENNEIFDFWMKTPEAGELTPICQIIPMQILAYQLAVLRGLNPDMPRNLAKSVTVK